MWREIKKIIHRYQNFIITSHVNPDGDGIGSAAAMIELLRMLKKQVYFVCDSPIPKKFDFLNVHGLHHEYHETMHFLDTEVLIILDTNKLDRIGQMANLASRRNIVTVCIDHHEKVEPFTHYYAVDTKASSVGTMIYTLFKECGFDLNLQAATGIYASVICDTGRFSYSSTNRKAHKIADECIKKGVDPDTMYSKLYQHVTLNQFKVFAHSLQSMELYFDNRVIVHPIRKEDYEDIGVNVEEVENIDFEYVLELNKQIEEVECVVLLRELSESQVRVSMRSKSNLDISMIMRQLGGGGHSKAAGATYHGTLKDAKMSILQLLEKEMVNSAL